MKMNIIPVFAAAASIVLTAGCHHRHHDRDDYRSGSPRHDNYHHDRDGWDQRRTKPGPQAAPALHNRQSCFLSPPVPASVDSRGRFSASGREQGWSVTWNGRKGHAGKMPAPACRLFRLSGRIPCLFPHVGTGGGGLLAAFDEPRTGYRLEKARCPRHSMRQINDYR